MVRGPWGTENAPSYGAGLGRGPGGAAIIESCSPLTLTSLGSSSQTCRSILLRTSAEPIQHSTILGILSVVPTSEISPKEESGRGRLLAEHSRRHTVPAPARRLTPRESVLSGAGDVSAAINRGSCIRITAVDLSCGDPWAGSSPPWAAHSAAGSGAFMRSVSNGDLLGVSVLDGVHYAFHVSGVPADEVRPLMRRFGMRLLE